MPDGALPVLDVRDLKTVFRTRGGEVHAVNSVSFDLKPGELLGVVGESGSGKSVTMMSLIGLLPCRRPRSAAVRCCSAARTCCNATTTTLRAIRGARIGFIFQDPMTSLNPVFTVGFQMMEPLRKHMGLNKRAGARPGAGTAGAGRHSRCRAQRLKDYPHQFSGGMRQRVMIAIALACDPKVLIADEPTTALDVTIQAQILELVKELRQKLGMAIVWITHDLGVIAGIADRVIVMYGGQIVEQAPVQGAVRQPAAPLYPRPAANHSHRARRRAAERLRVIEGQPPILRRAAQRLPVPAPLRPGASSAATQRTRRGCDVGDGHDVGLFLGPCHRRRRAMFDAPAQCRRKQAGRGARPEDALPDLCRRCCAARSAT